MPSKALEINIESSRVDVTISEKYAVLQEVMSKYKGIMESFNTFLIELCHPYKNWQFIIKEARGFSLDYFHLTKAHPKGPDAVKIYIDVFIEAILASSKMDVRSDAADNLLLYLQKIVKESGTDLPRFLGVLEYACEQVVGLEEERFFFFVKSFYQISQLGKALFKNLSSEKGFGPLNALFIKYLRSSLSYWLRLEDPYSWFSHEADYSDKHQKALQEIFDPISHATLTSLHEQLDSVVEKNGRDSRSLLDALTRLPGYRQIADTYRGVPQRLLSIGEDQGQGMYWKLIFLFHIMNTEGLSSIHEETLREINRTFSWLIGNEEQQDLRLLMQKTFDILKSSIQKFPGTALHCLQNMGRVVYGTNRNEWVDFFVDSVIGLGFQTPDLKGVTDTWQIKVNAAHIQNIRTWMELIELSPKWSKKLISSLIIYLSLGGVFIKDTDVFPRDITRFLNSDISPIYNLVKQLMRLLPAFFNDIGAEGLLRDISTEIDEVCQRKDVLIHFLRKQSHVESSNQIVGLIEATLNFWWSKDKNGLKAFIPDNIYQEIETEGIYVDGVHRLINRLFKSAEFTKASDLLTATEARIEEAKAKSLGPGVSDVDQKRIELAISLYRLLYQKYHLSFIELDNYLNQCQPCMFPDMEKLKTALAETDPTLKLVKLLVYLEKLKESILSPEEYEVREDIYHKRHFTVDIPSMYGSYHEKKFDALGLTFRLESLVNVLFENLVENINLELITKDTFSQIYNYLLLFNQALGLDGIVSSEMERQLDLLARSLEIRAFSFTQFLDIFHGFSMAVRNIVNDYFDNLHQQNLFNILSRFPVEALLPKFKPQEMEIDREKFMHRVTEVFLRERISMALGLQQLDVFLGRIMNTLFQQADKLPKDNLRLLLNYDPQKAVTPINPVKKGVSNIIHLGNKGLNLVRLSRYGFPVPPGFIITTEVFRALEVINNYPTAEKNLRDQIAREITVLENTTGKSFGNPENPLLLSVRSGSAISQPGMMDTFLNVGINEDIVQGIIHITGEEWFAWDCYRRFLQSYGMAFGLTRDDFDDIIGQYKKDVGIPVKIDFTGEQMKQVALSYKDFIRGKGLHIEDSPFKQLHITIKKVFESWDTVKAKTYRNIIHISDDWGTAVTVQAMVFGNLSQQSGSGVVFTHSPRWSGETIFLWGDFTLGNQGEDVVSGLVKTLPISIRQSEMEGRREGITLESHFPEIYQTIKDLSKNLIYTWNWSPQEMEFTFESNQKKDLYFLQTRDMAIRERKMVLSFADASESAAKLVGHGIGVSGGAMTGRVVFNLEEIHHWREKEPETSLLLIRGDTVPDDIKEIYEADGLLTARGGSTSHAAIVAHRLGKTCVVGCGNLICFEKSSSCSLDGIHLKVGDWLSIDGREGSIYFGKRDIKEIARR
ncbi:MAG: pyruvate, phosphate dikinase [Deltaproteobacteria bacterium]|nr:pyruvate, phosphate dikinase [Deltaproteobacteria bacterium]